MANLCRCYLRPNMFWKKEIFYSASQNPDEWIDGFLFVANSRTLDLLNTKLVLEQGPVELLSDVQALGRWLAASEFITPSRARNLVRRWQSTPEAASFLNDLLRFRERLRDAVLRIEAGTAPTREFLMETNQRLLRYPSRVTLCQQEGSIVSKPLFDPQQPNDLWPPILVDMTELLSEGDRHRIRQCESCFVHFLDTSKKGSRRWCSMKICGNRLKVAVYQKKKRSSFIP
jgi:predicted RNA-binding Zn ribbon-like protein